ncbi:MAG: response regulator, partial [Syntrophaceae bacterium]|nr:response regulator [Syntrophaceae bacterium]
MKKCIENKEIMAAIRVLVVDDEKKILRAVERLFFEDKYDVMTASSAKDGLSILSDVMPVWVVISDYRMPEMNGIEFLKHVNRRWPDVVKVILSGYEDSGKVIPFIDEGKIDKLILKPWNNNELRVSIANAVEIYELRKRNRELADELNRTNNTLQDLNNNMEEIIAEKTAELESIQKDIAQSERLASLETIAAGIAHEVKSPLERIIEEAGYVRSALPGDARITDGAETIKKASLRAGRAIKGLLSLSSQHSLEKSLTDVTGVIADVLSSVEYQIRLR